MPNSYYSLFDRDNRCLVLVDADVKRRSAHGDNRCRGEDSMTAGTTTQALDVNLDTPEEDVDQVTKAAGILPEDVRNSVETSGPPGPLVYAARA